MAYTHKEWPCWYYGPDGQSGVFEAKEDVPNGWVKDPAGPKASAASKKKKSKRSTSTANKPSTPAEDEQTLTREEAVSLLQESGIEVGPDASNEEIEALIREHLGDED
jgi:hypothetical protein